MQQVASDSERKKMDENAFFKLEKVRDDEKKAEEDKPIVEKIIELNEEKKDDFKWN